MSYQCLNGSDHHYCDLKIGEIVRPRAKNAIANNEHGNTSSMDLLTDVGGVVSAGDGKVDDVLVGGGEQGDDEQAKHQQHPSQAGAWLVAHASKQ